MPAVPRQRWLAASGPRPPGSGRVPARACPASRFIRVAPAAGASESVPTGTQAGQSPTAHGPVSARWHTGRQCPPWRTGRELVTGCPQGPGDGGSQAVSVGSWVGLILPCGTQAVSATRRRRRACVCVLRVWVCPGHRPGARGAAYAHLLLPLGHGDRPPGTNCSRPLPTLSARVYSAVMPVKSEPGAARLGTRAAARGKPVCDAPCHRLPPGHEPGPSGVPAPAEWCWLCDPAWHSGRNRFWVGMVSDCGDWHPSGGHVPQVT